ncbi:WxL domain-containing protein [Rhodococcus rhodochrous]|uniref:WxL domain-containing protein n=1 Tax=Rhodococcus rhodochrous TaxID=1829 RepID=UPI001E2FA160|nr:WxL domain-containing protein [Rhodococcus rhodochrous]MCB8913381.1 WxL domain-containing protein [Rhodococcus rhodochrous]
MRVSPSPVGAAVAAVGLAATTALLAPAVASAQEDTTTTFAITGGSLNITAQGTADLGAVATGAQEVSGPLGDVTVTDARGSQAGWGVTVSSSSFVVDGVAENPTTIPATAVDYAPGTPTETGTITATGTDATGLDTAKSVMAGTAAQGNNTASWTPTLTVTLPSDALAGTYTGTVTTSVA